MNRDIFKSFIEKLFSDKKILIIYILSFTLIFFILSSLYDKKWTLNLNGFISKQLEERKGNPFIFKINDIPYSARQFNNELLYERKNFSLQYGYPDPIELKKNLDSYIDETVILDAVISEIELDQPEVRNYLWPYLRKGLIAYYLNKKSGILEINNKIDDLEIPESELKQYYFDNKDKFSSKLSEEDAMKRISNTARSLKWKRQLKNRELQKKDIILHLKAKNKIKFDNKVFSKMLENP